jgi:phosphoglycolate phosphatase
MKKLTYYDHIIWDWNGTLLNDAWLCVDIVNGLLSKRGKMPVTPERYQHVFDFPIRDYYPKIGFDFSDEPFETVAIEFIDMYYKRVDECRLQNDAESLLKAFCDRHTNQYLLSASHQSALQNMARSFKVDCYFKHISGLNDHYADSKVENARAFLTPGHIDPGTAILLGDTTHDQEVADALGIDSILIPSGHHSREKLENTGNCVMASLTELHNSLIHYE